MAREAGLWFTTLESGMVCFGGNMNRWKKQENTEQKKNQKKQTWLKQEGAILLA